MRGEEAYGSQFKDMLACLSEDWILAVLVLRAPNLNKIAHVYGEQYMSQLVHSLKKYLDDVGYPDVPFFIGNHRDIVVLVSAENVRAVNDLARAIGDYFKTPWYYDEFIFFSNVHVGIASCPEYGLEAEEILRYATLSANEIEMNPYSEIRWFQTSDKDALAERLVLLGEVMAGINNDEFELFYQPQVDVFSGLITAVECLVRWNHPVRGRVNPGEFIPLLEAIGSIYSMDMFIVHLAVQSQQKLEMLGFKDVLVGVNLSGASLNAEAFDLEIIDIIEMNKADPEKIVLEVTETVDVLKNEKTVKKLEVLNQYGFKLAIDDFGQGYSSLNYVMRLPVHIIKVDKCLVDAYCSDDKIRFMTDKIVEIANYYNMQVIFEGVEEEKQVAAIQEIKMRNGMFQGFYFFKPMCFDELVVLLKNESELLERSLVR